MPPAKHRPTAQPARPSPTSGPPTTPAQKAHRNPIPTARRHRIARSTPPRSLIWQSKPRHLSPKIPQIPRPKFQQSTPQNPPQSRPPAPFPAPAGYLTPAPPSTTQSPPVPRRTVRPNVRPSTAWPAALTKAISATKSPRWQTLLPLLAALLAAAPPATAADQPVVEQLRIQRAPDQTRLVFDLNRPLPFYRLPQPTDPERLIIDLPPVDFRPNIASEHLAGTPIRTIHRSLRPGGGIRLNLELLTAVRAHSYQVPADANHRPRLVVELAAGRTERRTDAQTTAGRDILIAIDAGHGGKDPGALGRDGVHEKQIVLALSRQIKAAIDAQPGYAAMLVRDGDHFLPLRERFKLARAARADLLLSIHADSFRLSTVRGASIYALSLDGVSSEAAAYLAERENRADLAGGIRIAGMEDSTAYTVLDLSMRTTLEASLRAGQAILAEMGRVTKLHRKTVERADFAILKSPDLPSLLIEAGFMSNPQDARQLADTRFQARLAAAIARGVRTYFAAHPPPGTAPAGSPRPTETFYTVVRGDTLSEIAERFNVPQTQLRTLNNLDSPLIKIGQRLRIPPNPKPP